MDNNINNGLNSNNGSSVNVNRVNGIEIRCKKCNTILKLENKFCTGCGEAFSGDNVVVSKTINSSVIIPEKDIVSYSNFDKMYSLTEDLLLEEFINRELIKLGIDKSTKMIPSDVLKRKKVFNIIFSILVFVFISMIFFHFPIYTYIIGIIILLNFFVITRRYNLMKFLKKEIKSRPGEKICNILMNVKNSLEVDSTKKPFVLSLLISVILPLVIFYKPIILYERVDNGYAVRYYIYGVSNYKTAVIPDTYKNKSVVSLRGNTFSNMLFLKSVKLPDSIVEIRGQAFKNCYNLVDVNIPKNLTYLGGGAFYNAISIKKVELPDTLTYLGGESFYNAYSLEYIKLSNNLTEIRGSTCENCVSLKSIVIPDNVTRIGGHAFYGNSSLYEVIIGENSKLEEIGSSAFRQCDTLYRVKIPADTYVNSRAFKESPTKVEKYGEEIVTEEEELRYTTQRSFNVDIFDDEIYYESEYYLVSEAFHGPEKIFINDGEKDVLFYIDYMYGEFLVHGRIINNKYHDCSFDFIIEFYDKDYNKMSNCLSKASLFGKDDEIYFSSIFRENNVNGDIDDAVYYKIYINNYNILK